MKAFDDGPVEPYPRVLANPFISMRSLEMVDSAMENFANGTVSDPVIGDEMLAALETNNKPGHAAHRKQLKR